MKTLIVYFSFSGNNKMLAINIASDIEADVIEITEPKKRGMFKIMLDIFFNRSPKINDLEIRWEEYDHIMLMAPIWNYIIAHPMKSFIKKEKEHLKNYSFITVCSGREKQKEKIRTQLKKLTAYEPKAIIEFEILDLITSEEQDISKYEVTQEDLEKFKNEKAYQMLLDSFLVKEETS